MSDLSSIGDPFHAAASQGLEARPQSGASASKSEGISLPAIEDLETGESPELSFGDLLADGVRAVSDRQQDAKDTIANFAAGRGAGVHDVMMAMGKSEIAFSMMLEVRNRLVDAWREVTRIQV